ncbi:LacI family DNA-binding transcriptional regulator [Phytohabitans suffuscus]|uniref:LacI family transcriptional regulator n=1 Tax=Phytohabitans suffuscus TaxID=624315 RepID=A0A6F8YZD9_9ACTN|nr:LacI family DNA-binding transcriptional regulator [Phytohabitans suffuscus]BCB91363.1 LacI family transcriptional regulator [Phytohabitans suffuscus]
MTDKVTIYEVAARAGVSISTVSLVLNAPTRVRQATRERVLSAADELGFVPKADAVTRARRGVGRIGVIAPFSSYPSFSRRLAGVFAAIGAEALEVVVFDQQSAASATSPLLSSLPITRRLDGLIIMGLPLEESVVERLRAQRLPTVVIDSPRPRFEAVVTDDEAGGELVARHLLERGHERFGYVGEAQRSHAYVSPSESRLAGFRRVVAHRLPDEAVRLVRHDVTQARAATHALLDLPDPPTAIFAHDDTLAGGVLAAARDRGLPVPAGLAVAGFDDSELAQALDLTTVRQPFEESGRLALRALLDQLQDTPTSRRTTLLDLELVVRATT